MFAVTRSAGLAGHVLKLGPRRDLQQVALPRAGIDNVRAEVGVLQHLVLGRRVGGRGQRGSSSCTDSESGSLLRRRCSAAVGVRLSCQRMTRGLRGSGDARGGGHLEQVLLHERHRRVDQPHSAVSDGGAAGSAVAAAVRQPRRRHARPTHAIHQGLPVGAPAAGGATARRGRRRGQSVALATDCDARPIVPPLQAAQSSGS